MSSPLSTPAYSMPCRQKPSCFWRHSKVKLNARAGMSRIISWSLCILNTMLASTHLTPRGDIGENGGDVLVTEVSKGS